MPLFYISGSLGTKAYRPRVFARTTHRLFSLHESYIAVARKFVQSIEFDADPRNIEIMFDSGAFSAWSRGDEVDLKQLLRVYIAAFKRCTNMKFKAIYFINLDKIPGSPSRTATSEEITEALRISDENYDVLTKELGAERILPVFHQNEPTERLREIAAMNPAYVCVSPRNDLGEQKRREWANRAHKVLAETATSSHGLAATGGEMMTTIPWYSVDSASWITIAAYGAVMFLHKNTWKSIAISEHSSSRRFFGQHIDHGDRGILQGIKLQCEEIGLSIEELRTKFGARELFNIYSLQKIAIRAHRPVPVQETLFGM